MSFNNMFEQSDRMSARVQVLDDIQKLVESHQEDYAINMLASGIVKIIRYKLPAVIASRDPGAKMARQLGQNGLVTLNDYVKIIGNEELFRPLLNLSAPSRSGTDRTFGGIKLVIYNPEYSDDDYDDLGVPDTIAEWRSNSNAIVLYLSQIIKSSQGDILDALRSNISHEMRHALDDYRQSRRGYFIHTGSDMSSADSYATGRDPISDTEEDRFGYAEYMTRPSEINARYSEALLSILNWLKGRRETDPSYTPSNKELHDLVLQALKNKKVIGDYGLLADNPKLRSQYQRIISRAYSYIQNILKSSGLPTNTQNFDKHPRRLAPTWKGPKNVGTRYYGGNNGYDSFWDN